MGNRNNALRDDTPFINAQRVEGGARRKCEKVPGSRGDLAPRRW